ncbi:spore germination protein GerPC [Desertibacillus haloalkaliphilus]|uniref:spore germination protein GerPC n=1 Tax=Desertibacillus haloalkaliphilus TaxID=1328930 RepID=UPI001C27AF2A|nr:spore germination protein GerPC [Desertibacillus haloalkaliphilus]MBU8906374.1 spore germination protein GerPC [Desertibacillus haloalkaliphilus]
MSIHYYNWGYPYFQPKAWDYEQPTYDYPQSTYQTDDPYLPKATNNKKNEENEDLNEVKPNQTLALLEKLQKKIEEIEEENQQLKEKLESIQPINIENINYKVQELTVKELSGTLNIGMTALTDPENIKELIKEHEDITFNDLNTEEFNEMEDLENEEGPEVTNANTNQT